MSRDWTPRESYEVEKYDIAHGGSDMWKVMRSVTWHLKGKEPERLYSDEEIGLRQQYPYLGKFLENFMDLFGKIADFDNGLDFLKQKDAELGEYIEHDKGDREGYLAKWFEGELDPCFHHRERNNELLIAKMCEEAMLTRSNWCLTDPDNLQCRRQVGFEDRGVFELIQVEQVPDDSDSTKSVYVIADGEIDFDDYTQNEINSVLDSFGYDDMKSFVQTVGGRNEAYGQLAEMLFEVSSSFYTMRFSSWNEALEHIEYRTKIDLGFLREKDSELDKVIVAAKKEADSLNENLGHNKEKSENREL